MTVTATERREPLAISRIAVYGLIAIVVSIAANLVVRTIGMAIVDVSPEFLPLSEPIPTILFTGTLVLSGTAVFAVVDRFSASPRRVFNIIAFVALLFSFIPDVGILVDPSRVPFGGITFAAVAILLVQHVVAYAITVYTLTVLAYRR